MSSLSLRSVSVYIGQARPVGRTGQGDYRPTLKISRPNLFLTLLGPRQHSIRSTVISPVHGVSYYYVTEYMHVLLQKSAPYSFDRCSVIYRVFRMQPLSTHIWRFKTGKNLEFSGWSALFDTHDTSLSIY